MGAPELSDVPAGELPVSMSQDLSFSSQQKERVFSGGKLSLRCLPEGEIVGRRKLYSLMCKDNMDVYPTLCGLG